MGVDLRIIQELPGYKSKLYDRDIHPRKHEEFKKRKKPVRWLLIVAKTAKIKVEDILIALFKQTQLRNRLFQRKFMQKTMNGQFMQKKLIYLTHIA